MYEFAILIFLGLITAKAVDFVRYLVPKSMHKAVVLVLTAVAGVGLAYLLSFSMFAAWGVAVRAETIGTFVTGLFIAGFAGVWHEVLGLMREWAHRYHGEATEIEARLSRAA